MVQVFEINIPVGCAAVLGAVLLQGQAVAVEWRHEYCWKRPADDHERTGRPIGDQRRIPQRPHDGDEPIQPDRHQMEQRNVDSDSEHHIGGVPRVRVLVRHSKDDPEYYPDAHARVGHRQTPDQDIPLPLQIGKLHQRQKCDHISNKNEQNNKTHHGAMVCGE